MENIITKELLSKVLKIEIISCQMKQKNIIGYEYNKVSKNQWSSKTFCNRSINIYELANKCKEWAFEFRFDNKPTNNRYYRQRSGYEDKFNVEKQKREKLGYMTLTFGCLGHTKTFYADTEPEAIFKACQWILENKTNKEG